MTNILLITGTDTGIGKTTAATLLLRAFNEIGLKTFGIKPLSSGCQRNEKGQLRHDDAVALQSYSTILRSYNEVNPIAFEKPIAPHLAANEIGLPLSQSVFLNHLLSSLQDDADINVIEGAGGWCVPLNNHQLLSDIYTRLSIPVILVVGVKLGCLNHALLTYQSMKSAGTPLIGWIANTIAPETLSITENIQTLCQWIDAPCLGVIPHNNYKTCHLDIAPILTHLFQDSGITRREC